MNNKVALISLGCAKNRVNSEQMMYLLREAGYQVTGNTHGADVAVINTCGFIESAKTEAIDTILEVAREKSERSIKALIVAGCLSQRYKDDILKELPEIDAILGTGSYDDIVKVVDNVLSSHHFKPPSPCHSEPPSPCHSERSEESISTKPSIFGNIDALPSESNRIISTSPLWAYLKIAEGCDNRCAYCCIPSIRGRYRSRPMEAIIDEAKHLAETGYKELILVAQDTTAYGTDLYGRRSLAELLRKLGSIEKLSWIRLMYLYPDGFDTELIDEIENNDRIVKYLDIPIQHINDGILRNMNRRGTSADIRRLFDNLKSRIPNLVLRTSIITGLPGEGEQEFQELCDFLQDMRIPRAGVFPYSPEEGTKAAMMEYPSAEISQERAGIIDEIQSDIMAHFNKGRIGTLEEVLIEGLDSIGGAAFEGNHDKALPARSYAEAPEIDGYIQVITNRNENNASRFAKVRLKDIVKGELYGFVE